MSIPVALDSLTVDVVIDNVTDSYSSKPANVSSEFINVIDAGAGVLSGTTLCCAQLGLALVLTATVGKQRRKLLFDAGPEGAIFIRNAGNLGIRLEDIEAMAVSHGHWDHMGAMLDVLTFITDRNGGRELPSHVHDGMFRERGARLTDGRVAPFEPVPTLDKLATCGAGLVNDGAERFLLDGCFYLSGEIPRVSSFEKGRPDHLYRPSPEEEWAPDPLIMDERYVAVHLRDKGVLIFSACSHAGVINVLIHARERFASAPLYGVFGGLHLSGEAMEALIPETVAALAQFGLRHIIPAHCTGWRAVHALLQAFGESIVTPSAVGSRFQF